MESATGSVRADSEVNQVEALGMIAMVGGRAFGRHESRVALG